MDRTPASPVPPVANVDSCAPPIARALLTLAQLDAQIEALKLRELALVWGLERVNRSARAASNEVRAQEIQVLFVETSPRYVAPPEALHRLREWLEGTRQRCQELATVAAAEAADVERRFGDIQQRVQALRAERDALTIAPDLIHLYQAAPWSPRIVPVERGTCSACGAAVAPVSPDAGLRACASCHRVLYWRTA